MKDFHVDGFTPLCKEEMQNINGGDVSGLLRDISNTIAIVGQQVSIVVDRALSGMLEVLGDSSSGILGAINDMLNSVFTSLSSWRP
jgi:hypothetical protein